MATEPKQAVKNDGSSTPNNQTPSKAENTSLAVTPPGLESVDTAAPPAPGGDPDSLLRAAKHQLAAPHTAGDDVANDSVEKVARARQLIEERNACVDAARVKAIDSELEGLGFTAPVATTEAQRRDAGPVGRRAPGTTTV